jgi:peptide/nickel transport system substrate-binding protein
MRRPAARLAVVGASVLAAVSLGACTTPALSSDPASPSATTATATGVGTPIPTTTPAQRPPLVVETVFDHTSLDPTALVDRGALFVAGAVYQTLTVVDPKDPSAVLPGLAEWSISPEGNWLTLRLRAGAKFSDGSPITSDDVIFSLARATGLGGPAADLLGPLTSARVDDRTVILTSPGANFTLPTVLANPAFGILNSEVLLANGGAIGPGDAAGPWFATHSAGSGPYVISGGTPGEEIRLAPNPHWAGQRPAFSDVVIRRATPTEQLRDVQSGAADVVLDLSPRDADAVRLRPAVSSVAITTRTSSSIAFLLLNADKKVNRWTADPEFATAVRLGLDVDAITNLAGPGAQPALGLVPTGIQGAFVPAAPPSQPPAPTTPGGTGKGTGTGTPAPPASGTATSAPGAVLVRPTAPARPSTGPGIWSTAAPPPGSPGTPAPAATPTEPPARDLASAKAALARSGYKGATIPLAYAQDRPIQGLDPQVVAEEVRRQLSQVGIRVALSPAPAAKAQVDYRNGTNVLGLWSWAPPFINPEAALTFAPGGLLGVRAGWLHGMNPGMDDLSAATRTAYGDARPGAFARWQQQMNELSPFVPLFQPASHQAHGDRVSELPATPLVAVDLAKVR